MKSNEPKTLRASGESSALLYRPALWVLYASLISIYMLLRFVLIGERWPTRQDVQLEIFWAVIGTAALLVSSVTIAMAKRSSHSDRLRPTRRWLMLTSLLGTGFAIFQASEYRNRCLHNLIPAPFGNSLHNRADLYYLSAVQQRLIQLATEINTNKVRQNQLAERLQNLPDEMRGDRARLEAELGRLQTEESQRAERLAVINRLLNSEVKWTSSVVATSDDLGTQRIAIAALAYDIHRLRAFTASYQQFRQLESQQLDESQAKAKGGLLAAETSAKENSEPIKELLSAVAEVKAEQQDLESQLKSHLRQPLIDEELEDAPEKVDDLKRVAIERQLAEVHDRLEERNAKLTAAAKLVTDAEDNASRLSQELSSYAARQVRIAEIDAGLGLNQTYEWLQLPVCIPGGTVWAWTYFILTITHAIHLAYVLIFIMVLATVSGKVSSDRLLKTKQIARNWHSMVIVWVILFVLIYLI